MNTPAFALACFAVAALGSKVPVRRRSQNSETSCGTIFSPTDSSGELKALLALLLTCNPVVGWQMKHARGVYSSRKDRPGIALAPGHRGQPMAADAGDTRDERWTAMLSELRSFAQVWGNADPPLNTHLGRWCALQRKKYAAGTLDQSQEQALEDIGLSWVSPSDVDDPLLAHDWEDMCGRFTAYVTEHGDGQVPKKYKPDPLLGGWVACVRRTRESLGPTRVAQLDALGFEWVSTRQCGSLWMSTFRLLRDFYDEHGHADVSRVLGEDNELTRWCRVQCESKRKERLQPKRVAYLDGICFDWEEI